MKLETIKGLLQSKADCRLEFTEDEALLDIEINDNLLSTIRITAERWSWSKSKVGRFLSNLKQKEDPKTKEWDKSGTAWDNDGTKRGEIDTILTDLGTAVGQEWDSVGQNRVSSEPGKESFSPTPPFQRNSPPSPIKKKPPKGGKKEKSPSPTDSPQKPKTQTEEIGAAAGGGHLRLVEPESPSIAPAILEHVEPFSLEDAAAYFAGRLKTDETARKRGFDAGLLANSFYWHWKDRSFTDEKTGKRIDVKSWKRRAGTWWTLKDKYNPEAVKKAASGGLREDRWTFK